MTKNNNVWSPPRSPEPLIQEDLWPNEWKILVACILLNLTTRKQVETVIYDLFDTWPDAASLSRADEDALSELLKPLGMYRRRAKSLRRMSHEYLSNTWSTAKDLYGCGKYADDCWRIFCKGDWRNVQPQDHALNFYHNWLSSKEAA
jgi:methyl-CpG-binding domain protein 4